MYHSALFLGGSGKGKSVAMKKMLFEFACVNRFYNVVAFCGNKEVMRDMETMVHPSCVHFGFDEKVIESTLAFGEQLLALNQEKGDPHRPLLMILDDIAAYDKKAVNGELMRKIISQGRHMGVCVWVTAQTWKQINTDTRTQYSDLILCNEGSPTVLTKLLEIFGIPDMNPKAFKNLMARATKNYGMLVLRLRKGGGALQMMRTYRVTPDEYKALDTEEGEHYTFRSGNAAVWASLYRWQILESDKDIEAELRRDVEQMRHKRNAARKNAHRRVEAPSAAAPAEAVDFAAVALEAVPDTMGLEAGTLALPNRYG